MSDELHKLIDSQTEEFLQSPLGKVFNKLNQQGVRVYKDCGIDQKDGLKLITEGGTYKGPFAFLDLHESFKLLETNKCLFRFGYLGGESVSESLLNLGKLIQDTLHSEGIKCILDGNHQNQILIETIYRYKDYFSYASLIKSAYFNKFLPSPATQFMLFEICSFLDQDIDIDEDFDHFNIEDDEDDLSDIFNIFSQNKQDFRNTYTNLFKMNGSYEEFLSDEDCNEDLFRSEDEFLNNVNWDQIWEAVHYLCDRETIKRRLGKICGINYLDVVFERDFGISEEEKYYINGLNKATQDKNDEAIIEFSNAIRIAPDFLEAYINRGDSKLILNDYKGSIDDYTKAIAINPNNISIYLFRAEAKFKGKDNNGAILEYNKIIDMDSNCHEAYLYLGYIKNNLGNFEEAVSDLTSSIEIIKTKEGYFEEFHKALYYRGIAKFNLKDFEGSIEDFDKIIMIDDKYRNSYFLRGRCRYFIDDRKGACEDWEKAAELGDDEAAKLLKEHCK